MILRSTMIAALLMALMSALPARAGETGLERGDPIAMTETEPFRAVIELFTSQGCSSCPPADAVLEELSRDASLITLTFPVDYWDYLGWKDTLGSPRNSDRQRGYAKNRGDGAIYTPQAVINGATHVNGAKKSEIMSAIDLAARNTSGRVPVRLWQERNTLNIATAPSRPGQPPTEATIWLGVVQSKAEVAITSGENAGKTLTYTNVVRDLAAIGLWKGQALRIQIPRGAVMLAETEKIVVLVQESKSGPIVGAAWGSLF